MITVEEFVERLCRVGADRGPRRFPRKQRDREIMMKSIRLVIDHERTYSEPEINDVIRVWRREVAPAIDTDHVNIRRMLTDHGHLERTADGRFYRLGFPARPIAFDLEVDTIDVRATVAAYRQRGGGPPTADPEVNALLDTWLAGACEVLGGTLTGAWLVGSFAFGDADPHSSVDFVAAVEGEVGSDRLAALQALHRRIHDLESPWAPRLAGAYVPLDVLRRRDSGRRRVLHLEAGASELVRSPQHNSMVVRCMVRERGVTLLGPDPWMLVDPIDPRALRDEVRHVMHALAEEIRRAPERLANHREQPEAVLAYCRMLYTLEFGAVVSKPVAGRWAILNLDPAWSDLVERALAARSDPTAGARQPAEPADVEATRRFIDHALGLTAAPSSPTTRRDRARS